MNYITCKFYNNMKIKLLFSSLIAIAALWSGCKEKAPVIPELVVGDRKVLVEELTGVGCQNCPAGAEELRVLGETLGDNLIVVSLHNAASFDQPFPESRYDFRSEDCKAVANYIYVNGDPGAPAASVDRRAVTLNIGGGQTETNIFVHRPWTGVINSSASTEPQLGLFLAKKYTEADRKLEITVNVSPDIPQTGEIRLSVYITEDSIVDLQRNGTVIIPDYVHRHVFRDAVSAPTGDDISAALNEALPFFRTYSVTLPEAWVAKHCSIVAFIHKHGDTFNREILQADEIHVID